MKNNLKNKGFTLVELAIVIVIIGLLVGGVMHGQALIESAKVNRAVTDFKKYETAMLTFKAKYNALPGDMLNAYTFFDGSGGSSVCGGNNNSRLGCNGNGDSLIGWNADHQEVQKVWAHLNLSNINKDVSLYPTKEYRFMVTSPNPNPTGWAADTPNDRNTPLSTITEGAVFSLASPRLLSGGTYYGQTGLWISLSKPESKPIAGYLDDILNNVVSAGTAMNIDSKIDDGLPTTGTVLALTRWVAGSAWEVCATTYIPYNQMPSIAPSASITYTANQQNLACSLLFKTSLE
ncbi:prepilin-type N-terminal cleavage/methylation domain-containing protein [Runella sp. CRIBMP]|uniref:type II secretion system protein n=1 Tax=Runella sp. CRIBMP TaxID=2683261 RepID=UPI0014125A43|nr:prepilin-type N-terminal cleavage/methylation domain-containing protein [Runella sp. CRIBMP]NBB23399.1 prepilin-type N-terminal cleavage/methylation domain-containing protein [Runella sp. CRIBMP]